MVEQVEVHHPTSGEVYRFPVNRWVGVNRPASAEPVAPSSSINTTTPAESHSSTFSSSTSNQMIGTKKATRDWNQEQDVGFQHCNPPLHTSGYQVCFLTADKKSAGTVGDVFLHVVGDKGQSRPFQFRNHKGSRFQRGQTDRFQFACRDVGQVTAVKVAHVICGGKASPSHVLDLPHLNFFLQSSPPFLLACILPGLPLPGRGDQTGCWYLYQVVLSRLKDKHKYTHTHTHTHSPLHHLPLSLETDPVYTRSMLKTVVPIVQTAHSYVIKSKALVAPCSNRPCPNLSVRCYWGLFSLKDLMSRPSTNHTCVYNYHKKQSTFSHASLTYIGCISWLTPQATLHLREVA